MRIDDRQLLAMLVLSHETLARGDGLSLHTALTRSGYDSIVAQIRRSRLVPVLRAHPEVLQHWITYSERKPSNIGRYLVSSSSFEVASVESPGSSVRYGSVHEAVAEFIERELAYWSEVGHHNSASSALDRKSVV